MTGVVVSACGVCGWRGFPLRIWCPRCGNGALAEVAVERGVVEESTTLRRSVGSAADAAPVLGTIALEGGGRVIAVLDSAAPGSTVRVESDGGGIRAHGM